MCNLPEAHLRKRQTHSKKKEGLQERFSQVDTKQHRRFQGLTCWGNTTGLDWFLGQRRQEKPCRNTEDKSRGSGRALFALHLWGVTSEKCALLPRLFTWAVSTGFLSPPSALKGQLCFWGCLCPLQAVTSLP